MIIGIDPGKTGAIAAINADGIITALVDMPTLPEESGYRIDTIALASILREIMFTESVRQVRIERVNAMPARGKNGERRTMGATSAFNFGRSFGALEGVIGALGLPVKYVQPAAWKKAAGLTGKDKDLARTKALELYPIAELHRKKDIGRADALLIATFGG